MNIDWSDARLLMALINLLVSSAVGWACVCRIGVMSSNSTRPLTRAAYALLFAAQFLSGFSPVLLREWPGVSDILVNSALLLLMFSTLQIWRFGVPEYAKSEPVPLDDGDGKK